MKVLISDGLDDKGIEILKKGNLEVDVIKYTPEELIKNINKYHGLIVRSGTTVTKEIIAAGINLKVVGRAGSGLDNVDVDAATKKGIIVMNTPGGNTITTAEHSVSMLLSLMRMIPQATASMKSGQWEKKKLMGIEFFNKTLGVVGIGQIGTHVAKLAKGLMMNVIGYDPYLSEDKAKKLGIELVSLDEVFERSDFITLHVPSTKDTKQLIRKETIDRMKKGVLIVNCSRGTIVNEEDLLIGLESGKVGGAALDVFEVEPVPAGNKLVAHPHVICTPHLGAQTIEAQVNVAVAVAEQVVDLLNKGVVRNAANLPSLPPELLEEVRPYTSLAEKLGLFISQIVDGGIGKLTIEYRGNVSKLKTESITIAVLKGFLSPITEGVNLVNARLIAEERGVTVTEVKIADGGDFESQMTLIVQSGNTKKSVAGSLFVKKEPRIVGIDNFTVEVAPEGCMLVLFNNDKPGVIGTIGNFLGQRSINISRMQFGREMPGGKAITVVTIDTPLSDEQLNEVRTLPNVNIAKQIFLK